MLVRIDENRMIAVHELIDDEGDEYCCAVPIRFEVCGTCRGKGSHSLHIGAITADEWSRDWCDEDRARYLSGGYDKQCGDCGGRRVQPVIDESRLTADQMEDVERINEEAEADWEADQMAAAERRFGC